MKTRLIYFSFLCLIALFSYAQKDEATYSKIADQFFNNKEYDKAQDYYEKLYDKNQNLYYPKYLQCLIATKTFRTAEKIVKRQLKEKPEELNYYIDLASVYFQNGETNKAEDQYKKAIKSLNGSTVQCVALGQGFMSLKQYENAVECYLKGRKLNSDYPYTYELAEAYHAKGESKLMINEYLDLLESREGELQRIQSALQTNLAEKDEDNYFANPILKSELQKRMVNKTESSVLIEFYIWLLLQQKDFEAAYAQSKAIDKRKAEDGYRLMDLGKTCVLNEAFTTAQKCYEYVLSKGKENYYYVSANIEATIARYEKLIRNPIIETEIPILEKQFEQVITEYGISKQTYLAIKKYAQFLALYKSQTNKAVELLQQGIDNRSIEPISKAELKLDMADLLLASGEVWEASLLYSQVDKAFKYDPIGQEAKYRNAKLAFYNGDFKWSKAQLDVLKGATSKLISNDAMDLSLVISDALAIDTVETPLFLFAQADLAIIQNQFQKALSKFDTIQRFFPDHNLNDNIMMKKAEIASKQNKTEEAIKHYQQVVDSYSEDIFGDDALFRIAEIYQYKLGDLDKARETYKAFVLKYNSSVYAVEASKRYRLLRGDQIK
jgi:tetratricopeptide (TPR) repeat protein